MSSGIHDDSTLTFYWCDAEKVDTLTSSRRPRRLSQLQEAGIVIVSLAWGYMVGFKKGAITFCICFQSML